MVLLLWSIHRAESKRWFGVSWLCLDVFPEGKVIIGVYLALLSSSTELNAFDLIFILYVVSLGKDLKREPRNRNTRESVKKRFLPLLRLVLLLLASLNPYFALFLNYNDNWLLQALCRGYPTEFASYFHYCRSLRFDDRPDYAYLKRIFRDLFIREGVNIMSFRVHPFVSTLEFIVHTHDFDFNLWKTMYICSLHWHMDRIPVWLCVWLDNFEVSAITASRTSCTCCCKCFFILDLSLQQRI